MSKFHGDITSLKSKINEYGLVGEWSTIPNAQRFTASDRGILIWYNTHTLLCQGRGESKKKIEALIQELDGKTVVNDSLSVIVPENIVKNTDTKARPTVFIVYGHDEISRDQLELALKKMDVEHIILAKTNGKGLTIIEALESHVGKNGTADAGIVLLTPDDVGYAKKEGEGKAKDRARQNVVLEMGMLIAKLGRTHTIILVKGEIERPSDTDGIIYLPFKNNIKEVALNIAERLQACGFEIDAKKIVEVAR